MLLIVGREKRVGKKTKNERKWRERKRKIRERERESYRFFLLRNKKVAECFKFWKKRVRGNELIERH